MAPRSCWRRSSRGRGVRRCPPRLVFEADGRRFGSATARMSRGSLLLTTLRKAMTITICRKAEPLPASFRQGSATMSRPGNWCRIWDHFGTNLGKQRRSKVGTKNAPDPPTTDVYRQGACGTHEPGKCRKRVPDVARLEALNDARPVIMTGREIGRNALIRQRLLASLNQTHRPSDRWESRLATDLAGPDC